MISLDMVFPVPKDKCLKEKTAPGINLNLNSLLCFPHGDSLSLSCAEVW